MILAYDDYTASETYQADVVVVGTGAGGAAAGATLAEAGLNVVFVEEGGHHPTNSFNPYMRQSIPRLYRDAGTTVMVGNPSIPWAEGACVGGSTVVNGGMTYRPPDRILEDWKTITGCPDLGPEGLAPLFDHVEERISARPQRPDSIGADNKVMRDGAAQMGWNYSTNTRNQDQCVGTNNCILGCPTGAKRSTLVSWMPTALAAGARCLTEIRVESLLIEGGRCVGVKGRAINGRTRRRDKHITVRARAVVVAGGAVQTPLLLLKHRLGRPSRQLGKNFLCHPNAKLVGVFPFEVAGWKGVSQYGQVREFHDRGIVLAENFVPPSLIAASTPMIDGEIWDFLERYNNMVVGGCLVEDSTTGTVSRGPFGTSIVRYDITEHDRLRFIEAAAYLAEMWFEMGAEQVKMPYHGAKQAKSMDDVRAMRPDTIKKQDLDLFTVHLMGTARMGARAEDSVIDLEGQMWDLPGCYVADASVFPTAIAVNPQVTIMAMATRIARRLGERLGARVAA